MRHLFLAAMLYAASLASWAQAAYNPAVVYTSKSGVTWSIILANADGTHPVPVYSTKNYISSVTLAPGGGKVAFTQQDGLRVLPYVATNTGITAGTATPLDLGVVAGPADFSPDGTKILYVASSSSVSPQIRSVSVGGGPFTVLMDSIPNLTSITEAAWMRSGNGFAYIIGTAVDLRTEVRLATINGDGSVTPSPTPVLTTDGADFSDIVELSTARTRDSVLVRLNLPTGVRSVVEVDVATSARTVYLSSGARARFSNSDSKIVFLDPSQSVIKSFTIGSGATTALTKKGTFGTLDTIP